MSGLRKGLIEKPERVNKIPQRKNPKGLTRYHIEKSVRVSEVFQKTGLLT